ncbi:hypothetical protein BKM12_20540 [Pseudomonas syringae pv. syringae]|nr:hypothetical protein BKM12_20540 [Pseudomonas syringae pv. syringae]
MEQVAVLLADAVCLQSALFIVLVLAKQQRLLALLLAACAELVGGQARAVEVDAAQLSATLVVVIEFAAVRQAALAQLAKRVVLVAGGAPALMLGDQAVLQVVFVGGAVEIEAGFLLDQAIAVIVEVIVLAALINARPPRPLWMATAGPVAA